MCWRRLRGLRDKPAQETKSLFSRWPPELIPTQIPSPSQNVCGGCRGARGRWEARHPLPLLPTSLPFPPPCHGERAPNTTTDPLPPSHPQVFILYFKPSIFRCIVLRWVRMLGFATVYGTIALKLYR